MRRVVHYSIVIALAAFIGQGCKKKDDTKAKAEADAGAAKKEEGLKADKGVDTEKKTITIGALNDESGPAAAIGKPYAVGKRVLVEQANESGDMLPDGWNVNLVEKDHGYNPQKSVQAYKELKDDVLFFATSFGTPNTLPLRPMLEQDKVVAFPASLSSKMAEFEYTPPFGPAYFFEAMRAMDFAVEEAGGADKVKAGIIYQQDDYGQDGIHGWEEAARHHRAEIVSKVAISPGQKDFTAVVTSLKKSGATHVLLTTLPSATGPILGTAAQLGYTPMWLGNTPSWVDKFFSPKVIPPKVFGNFHLVTGLPYWGEEVPGMKEFIAAYEKYGKEQSDPDWYILLSYLQGKAELEAAKRAIEKGDITREGYLAAVHTLKGWDAGGMIQPIDLSTAPYVVGTKTRVLKPKMEKKSWEQAADYAAPKAYRGKGLPGVDAKKAPTPEEGSGEKEGGEKEAAE